MEFTWQSFTFCVVNERIYIKKFGNVAENKTCTPFVELQLGGRDHPSNVGAKAVRCSETENLRYVSHCIKGDALTVTQANELCEVTTRFRAFEDTNAVQVSTEVKNVFAENITVELLSSFVLGGLFGGRKNADKTYFTKFTQGHHCECQPRRFSLEQYGFNAYVDSGEKCLTYKNIGSWSSKEELPQGILEYDGKFLMFQIESNSHWQYTVSAQKGELNLCLSGGSAFCGNESKELQKGESLQTPIVAIACGNSLNAVIGEMTKYRRHIAGRSAPDEHLPVIFNEYMHLSWDSPTELNTRKIAPVAAKAGAEYYVIDCGWHNEEDGDKVYPYVGQWKESKARFPHGVRATTDYIRSLGMKAGLWIEPEIIGVQCEEMLSYYDENCFLHRGGKRIAVMGRYFLNFRAKKVIDYLSETIRRMVEDYGAQYIKMDYNEDVGFTDESLTADRSAYLDWIDTMRSCYPDVLMETCSSGGMRMDYVTLKHFSLVSTSDQTDYRLYPYISADILSAVLPEQAAVWNYPVVGEGVIGEPFEHDEKWVQESISQEQIVMNTVNALLGRMHLASHIELLSNAQFSLVQEGIEYYNKLTPVKKTALPYFPLGFTSFGMPYAACGLKADNKLYLAVWNLDTEKEICIPVPEKIRTVKVGYPRSLETDFSFTQTALIVRFKNRYTARFLEIETEKQTVMKEITGMQVKDYIRENLPRTVRHIVRDEDTLFGLPYPYTVPCADGMFNELYYWDTYFTNKALLVLGQAEQAANNTKDILYLIDRFGYMPNGNRTGFLRRSQPPYAALMVNDVYRASGDLSFLKSALVTLKKEYEFWMTRRVSENGLNHYDCEEDEESCAAMYNGCVAERIGKDDSRDPKEAGRHYFAECESGWDFNPRFDGYCAHCNPVDLNSNLYLYEKLFAEYEVLLGEGVGKEWESKAKFRAEKMNALMWDNAASVYKDYNYNTGKLSDVISAASFQPYFAGLADEKQRDGLLTLLRILESKWGIFTTEKTDKKYQWAFPNVWAPCQYVAVEGLRRYGYEKESKRIAQKYVALIEKNFAAHGKLFEKYNGITGDIDAISEYGTPEMLGWTAGVYMKLIM